MRHRLAACAAFVAIWAGPSFVIGWIGGFSAAGMGLGVLVYLLGLYLLATRPFAERALRRPVVRKAFVHAFVARLFAIGVFPIVLINDGIAGGLSLLAAGELVGRGQGFLVSATATCFEGLLLSVEFAIVAAIALDLCQTGRSVHEASRICLDCGYDLRGSPGRCPECGSAPFRAQKPA